MENSETIQGCCGSSAVVNPEAKCISDVANHASFQNSSSGIDLILGNWGTRSR